MSDKARGSRFSPTICVTHKCNLNCVYCYQTHDNESRMSLSTAKECIDWIFNNIPQDMTQVEIGFIGGEPLLEFELITQIYDYTFSKYSDVDYIFYATTNGTILTDDMKLWLSEHKERFVLGLSLDGTPQTHNYNRSNSFNKIDIEFFRRLWPWQGVKMTLSEYSLHSLADNIKYLHSLGFKRISGVNLFEGDFDWNRDEYLKVLIPQLQELVDFYVENDHLPLDQMMNRKIGICERGNHTPKKWCGIGTGTIFFDIDGTKRPCNFCTPMTFSEEQLHAISSYDFTDYQNFTDDICLECYIYDICPHCAGADYLTQNTFKIRDKSKCRIQKLIVLFIADLQAKRIVKNPKRYSDDERYYTINAIKNIRKLYLPVFRELLDECLN